MEIHCNGQQFSAGQLSLLWAITKRLEQIGFTGWDGQKLTQIANQIKILEIKRLYYLINLCHDATKTPQGGKFPRLEFKR